MALSKFTRLILRITLRESLLGRTSSRENSNHFRVQTFFIEACIKLKKKVPPVKNSSKDDPLICFKWSGHGCSIIPSFKTHFKKTIKAEIMSLEKRLEIWRWLFKRPEGHLFFYVRTVHEPKKIDKHLHFLSVQAVFCCAILCQKGRLRKLRRASACFSLCLSAKKLCCVSLSLSFSTLKKR